MIRVKPICLIIICFLWLSQPCKAILAQVQMNPSVPIHTIAFNCNDEEANCFLYQLANSTRGRYHYYTDNDYDVEPPESWKVSHFLSLYGVMQVSFLRLDIRLNQGVTTNTSNNICNGCNIRNPTEGNVISIDKYSISDFIIFIINLNFVTF